MNWKYLVYDIFKFVLPVLTAQYLPEGAPESAIITTVLYLFALVLGIDSVQKIIRAKK